MQFDILPDRSCGECLVCCRDLTIDTPGLTKLAGITCKNHVQGHGCAIYADRPPPCAEFYCGWRRIAVLGDEWRPDRCGIVIMWEDENPSLGRGAGFKFFIYGGLDRIFWRPFVEYVTSLVQQDRPTYIMVAAPLGYQMRVLCLNTAPGFRQVIAKRNFASTASALSQLVQVCIDLPKDRITFENPQTD